MATVFLYALISNTPLVIRDLESGETLVNKDARKAYASVRFEAWPIHETCDGYKLVKKRNPLDNSYWWHNVFYNSILDRLDSVREIGDLPINDDLAIVRVLIRDPKVIACI